MLEVKFYDTVDDSLLKFAVIISQSNGKWVFCKHKERDTYSIYDSDEVEIVCRYPQFFAAKLLKQSIVDSVVTKSGRGGTYFGATGCGKTYTMAFLARQLALRCTDISEIGSPTIILIVDRDELQKQGAKLFTKSTEFLNLGEVSVVKNRTQLRQELGARQSGGFYICTIQKFCDREDDKIGLINDRQNIICFSDEAHRTQLEHSKKIQFSKDADANMKAMVSKPYAKVLKEAFPQATFVGFTGTPIAETYQTFGDEIDRYTMDQAVADGLTVSIKYHPRIAKVLLDKNKVKEIEDYYKKCADDGATFEDVEASKKAMSSMEIILGEPSRLERLATDIHNHYVSACDADPNRIQKAMVVCSNRKIAYALLSKFKDKYPEWFEEKKVPDGTDVTDEELNELKPMPLIAMVSSVGKNDEQDMYNYLGGVKNDKRSEELDAAFKQEKSNFRIVIVVDMWITGFDVPCLTYLYNDKSHTLDKMKLHDKDLIDRVEKWHFRLTGSKKISDENYLICSNQLINLAEEILDAMLSCIRRIETDERKEHMIREMLMAKDNYCPDFYIESQFNAVMTAVGLKADAHILTKKYGKQIRDKMKVFSSLRAEEHDKKIRLLIEQILFSNDINICPLGGERIMLEFGLVPGKELGEMKRKAIELSQEDPYRSEEQLLVLLRNWERV